MPLYDPSLSSLNIDTLSPTPILYILNPGDVHHLHRLHRLHRPRGLGIPHPPPLKPLRFSACADAHARGDLQTILSLL